MFTKTHANKHWNKFGYENYKLNMNLFDKYCRHDLEIVKSSSVYNKLPKEKEVFTTPTKKTIKKRKRTRRTFELSSPEVTKECKIICVLSDSDSDTDDA